MQPYTRVLSVRRHSVRAGAGGPGAKTQNPGPPAGARGPRAGPGRGAPDPGAEPRAGPGPPRRNFRPPPQKHPPGVAGGPRGAARRGPSPRAGGAGVIARPRRDGGSRRGSREGSGEHDDGRTIGVWGGVNGTLFSRLPWGARTVTSREMRARRSNACVVMPGLALQSPRSDGRAIRIALFRDDCALFWARSRPF